MHSSSFRQVARQAVRSLWFVIFVHVFVSSRCVMYVAPKIPSGYSCCTGCYVDEHSGDSTVTKSIASSRSACLALCGTGCTAIGWIPARESSAATCYLYNAKVDILKYTYFSKSEVCYKSDFYGVCVSIISSQDLMHFAELRCSFAFHVVCTIVVSTIWLKKISLPCMNQCCNSDRSWSLSLLHQL